jgi:hypothetical protein
MQQWPLARGKLRKKVLHLLARGQVSRAVKLICSHSLADMYDPQIIDAMQAKYPERGRELPATGTVGQCVDNMRGMRERMMNLEPGVSPGFGGKRNEHLLCLAKVWGVQQMGLLETFSIQYLNGKFPPLFHQICESVASFPLFKNGNMKTVIAVLWAHPTLPSQQSWSLRGRCRRSASSTFRCTSLRSTAGTDRCPLPGITLAGCNVERVFCPGFVSYGIPVGLDGYVRPMLKEKVREVQEEVDKVNEVLDQNRMIARLCGLSFTGRCPRGLTTTCRYLTPLTSK